MARKRGKGRKTGDDLVINDDNGWSRISPTDKRKLQRYCDEYIEFLSTAKTERLCHDIGVEMALDCGYVNLEDAIARNTHLRPGSKIYHSAAGKTLTLIHVGKQPLTDGLRIIGGHTDSPRIDLKPRPLYEDGGMALFDTHYYGGIKKYQWVTIPLALHGVIVRKDGTTVTVSVGEDPVDPVFTITDLLPHLGQEQAAKKLGDAITGDGLNVLIGSIPSNDGDKSIKAGVLQLLHSEYGVDESDLTSAELQLIPAGRAREAGFDRSMIVGYGHDDRICAYAGMRALLDQKTTPSYTSVCILCDKEEIGSYGSTGMQSYLFENTMAEVMHLSEADYSDLLLRRCLKRSCMISADVNALHDPNYSSVSSPNKNMARLNQGVVLTKYTGSRGKSGSNDASAEYMGMIRNIYDTARVIWQTGELGMVDAGGGGTIAHMLARYEMNVVDSGVGVLSMHSPYEVAGKLDTYMTYKAYSAFYRSRTSL